MVCGVCLISNLRLHRSFEGWILGNPCRPFYTNRELGAEESQIPVFGTSWQPLYGSQPIVGYSVSYLEKLGVIPPQGLFFSVADQWTASLVASSTSWQDARYFTRERSA